MPRILMKSITCMCIAVAIVASVVQAQPNKARPKRQRPPRAQTQRVPASVDVERDMEYARPNDTPLLLDLYVPKDATRPLPLVVWIHGGAWRAGNKDRCPALRFTERGYVVASINYRLSQKAIFPAQIEDCKAAIRWLRANAAKYHIDPKHIGVWGSSAGGHLVALLGTSGDVKKLEGAIGGNLDQSSRVQAVCDFFGPTDFLQMDAHMIEGSRLVHDAPESPESRLVGGPIQENKDKVSRADPTTYATQDDPPFLIMHGDRDPLVPLHQSELLNEALKKANVDVAIHVVKGGGHGFGGPEISRRVDEFFDKHLCP